MSTYWLGVDVGTGGSRAILVDASGKEAAAVSVPHEEMVMEQALWAEQRPENWAGASFQAIRGALAAAGITGDQVRGVGLSGQMHGLVILDGQHNVIRPALIWCDQRSQPQVDWINRRLGVAKVLELTANPVLTGFTLPKLLWVRDHEPQRFESVRHVLLPKDYVRFRLTGELATEVSDASGTAMFDVVRRRWSFEMMDGLDLDRSILPRAYESADVTGTISEPAGALTGLAARHCRWPAVVAIRPPVPWAMALWNRARSPARWELPASSSRTWNAWRTIPTDACIPSVTRFGTSGT